MDTRSKKFSYHPLLKFITFMTLIVLYGVLVFRLAMMFNEIEDMEVLFHESYIERDDTVLILNNIIGELFDYRSEEYILSGEYARRYIEDRGLENQYDMGYDYDGQMQLHNYNETEITQDAINRFREISEIIKSEENIYIYATNGEMTVSNTQMSTRDEFKNFNYYNIIDDETWEIKINGKAAGLLNGNTVYMAYDDQYVEAEDAIYKTTKNAAEKKLNELIIMFLVLIILMLYLIWSTGRDIYGNLKLNVIDRLWTDVNICVLISLFVWYCIIMVELLGWYHQFLVKVPFVTISLSALAFAIFSVLVLSLIKHIKNRTLIKHSFCYVAISFTLKILKRFWKKIKEIAKTILTPVSLNYKIIGSVLLLELALLFFTIVLFAEGDSFIPLYMIFVLIINATAFYVMIKFILKPYDDEVKLRLEASINKQRKAEKLKTELVTNVSHDLKTPLTAIINYSDLLLKEDPENENAKIIYEKGQKLKSLTEGLFEVSKAQSGNLNMEPQKLKIKELVEQTLAEFNDHNIEFKVNTNDTFIIADGKLMSRVFENIIGNIIKYSMNGTRAYIDSYVEGRKVVIIFKNIAGYEMNFDAKDMKERFTRGDDSRSTEGNGLGLAIAESYVESCGGRLNIEIDGDLFKVIITFDKINDTP